MHVLGIITWYIYKTLSVRSERVVYGTKTKWLSQGTQGTQYSSERVVYGTKTKWLSQGSQGTQYSYIGLQATC